VNTIFASALVAIAGCFSVQAQEPAPQRPHGHVPTISTAPKIDGVLNDEAWGQALRLTELTEVNPNEGERGDPATEIWMMRDSKQLYLAFVCFEPTPAEMVLQNIKRDAFLNDDDRMEFVFDTFDDGQNGYFFQISAVGSRGDAQLGANGRRFNKPWNAFWKGKTQILEDRWIAEISIPFAALSFGDGDVWRANFNRFRGADRSTYRWASPRRELFVGIVSEGGELSGFSGIEQGHGLEFRPYLKAKNSNPYRSPSISTGEFGGELSWSVTPQTRASVTWNTDFAETEVDERQVNLTRYPLFFPEKRDFFLQDATLFQFGEVGSFGSVGTHLQPFFSRRIGLAGGREVPLDAGLRVASRTEKWDLGFLGVHMGESSSAGTPDSDLFVFRPTYHLAEGLALGGLLTSGNPASDEGNTVVGVDLRWSTASALPGNLSVNTFLSHTDDTLSETRGLGFGAQSELTTKNWNYRLSVYGSQGNYRPALGFVRRPGEMESSASATWSPRPESGPIRNFRFTLRPSWWTDLDGTTVSSTMNLGLLGIAFHSGEDFSVSANLHTDNPDSSFGIVQGVTIDAGKYDWTDLTASFNTSSGRPLAARTSITVGDWYDGTLNRFRADLIWRPNERMRTQVSYREEHVSLPQGDFTVRIESLAFDYSFSTDLSLENLLQSDNDSDTLGVQSRLRWLIADGREVFFVLNTGWLERDRGLIVPLGHDLTAKLVYAWRF
jgi:hypothetical protein